MKKKKMSMKKIKGYLEHTRDELEEMKIHMDSLAKTHILSKTMEKELEVISYVIEMKRAEDEDDANATYHTRHRMHAREKKHPYRWIIGKQEQSRKNPHLAFTLIDGPINVKQADAWRDYFTKEELEQFMMDQDLYKYETRYQTKTDMLLNAGARGIMPVPPQRYYRCKKDGHITIKQRRPVAFDGKCGRCNSKVKFNVSNAFISENFLEDN
jgi:hypothetical protein